MPPTELIISSQNVAYSGLYDADGKADPDRWNTLLGTMSAHRGHILLLQEVGRWTHDDQALLRAAEHRLGMTAAGIVTRPAGGGVTVFVDSDVVDVRAWEDRHAAAAHHGLGMAVLNIPGLEPPLAVISAHLHPYSCTAATVEAQTMIGRVHRHGGVGVIGGDINHFPADNGAIPDPAVLPAYNVSSRWVRGEDGTPQPNRAVTDVLELARMTDSAALVASRDNNASLLGATGRGGCRVDQIWTTEALTPAVVDAHVVHHDYSDHSLVSTTFDLARVDLALTRPWI